jgi:hypothetical protein
VRIAGTQMVRGAPPLGIFLILKTVASCNGKGTLTRTDSYRNGAVPERTSSEPIGSAIGGVTDWSRPVLRDLVPEL